MKTHLSLRTNNIDASVTFYRSLLNADPLKRYDDYALFVTQQPGLELALDRSTFDRTAKNDSASHYGIAVDSREAVDQATARLQAAGLAVELETEQTCCYAKQTKVWASDPDGRRWEVYHVLEESSARDGENPTCCTQESCDTFAACCGN